MEVQLKPSNPTTMNNENFDNLWSSLKDQVRKARTSEKPGTHRDTSSDWGYSIYLANEPRNGAQGLTISHHAGMTSVHLDGKSCIALAAELLVAAEKMEAEAMPVEFNAEAHGHLLAP